MLGTIARAQHVARPDDPGTRHTEARNAMSITATNAVASIGRLATGRQGKPTVRRTRVVSSASSRSAETARVSLRASPLVRRASFRRAAPVEALTPRDSAFGEDVSASSATEKPWWRAALDRAAAPALALALAVAALVAPAEALAASGGRMGGSSFRATSASRSMSSPSMGGAYASSRGYAAGGLATSAVLVPLGAPMAGGAAYGGGGGVLSLVFGVMIVLAFLDAIKNALGGDSGMRLGADRIAVVKIQIGLLGLARQLQLDLEDIAEAADTSSTEGLHYVLEETVLALLRNPEYCVYGYATSATADGPENAEDLFNEYSMDERGKFEEETLVNVNARKRASRTKNADGEENINEYILVTIIAACDGGLKLPAVTDGTELRTALKRVGAIRVDALQAVEVLWTPQEEGDTLSEDELLRDYPQLNVL